jgi:hypothetical protein
VSPIEGHDIGIRLGSEGLCFEDVSVGWLILEFRRVSNGRIVLT